MSSSAQEKRPYKRATTSQKCVRAGGKHNDLGNVGKTLRHHTFFEMLGNFSFGDYFKKDAIAFAWEFLLKKLNLDEEGYGSPSLGRMMRREGLWKAVGVSPSRIVRLGEKDNFWSMGDEGPCGPCSEIIYDLGSQVGCRTAYVRGRLRLRPLPGDLEPRVHAVRAVAGRHDEEAPQSFNRYGHGAGADHFGHAGKDRQLRDGPFRAAPRTARGDIRAAYGEKEQTDIAFRVIADHVRGATFIINDGVLPSKEGRGYVLRRIMRRAIRYGKKIGIEREFLGDLSRVVVDMMEDVYPEVKNNYPYILQVLKGEEERFLETLSVGMRLYEEVREMPGREGSEGNPGRSRLPAVRHLRLSR